MKRLKLEGIEARSKCYIILKTHFSRNYAGSRLLDTRKRCALNPFHPFRFWPLSPSFHSQLVCNRYKLLCIISWKLDKS